MPQLNDLSRSLVALDQASLYRTYGYLKPPIKRIVDTSSAPLRLYFGLLGY